jgi:hypothetical protein
MKKQTAVEWLISKLEPHLYPDFELVDLINQAKEMEKEQMEQAVSTGISKADMTNNRGYFDFDKYYKETYENK